METVSSERLEADAQVIRANVASNTHLDGFSIRSFHRLPSTNQTLWELVKGGAPPGTVVTAAEQSAGRGQWGRQWQSSRGGLYLSAYWQPQTSAIQSHSLTLCSGWGIATALRERGIPVRLKWPNDLLLDDRKLGGILTETRIRRGKIDRAVVGVGINWANDVPETGINLRSFLQSEGVDRQSSNFAPRISSLETLCTIVLAGLAKGWQTLQQEGVESLLSAYETLLVNIGQSVEIEGRSGTVVGVDERGNLRVRLASETGEIIPEICRSPGQIGLGYNVDRPTVHK